MSTQANLLLGPLDLKVRRSLVGFPRLLYQHKGWLSCPQVPHVNFVPLAVRIESNEGRTVWVLSKRQEKVPNYNHNYPGVGNTASSVSAAQRYCTQRMGLSGSRTDFRVKAPHQLHATLCGSLLPALFTTSGQQKGGGGMGRLVKYTYAAVKRAWTG